MRIAEARGVELNFAPRLLTDLFAETVERFGSRPAIDFMGRITSYAALSEMVDAAAVGLQKLGVRPGSRVALCLPNIIYYPVLFFATLKAGGTVVNVNPLYVERELRHLLVDSGADIIATCDIPDIHGRVSHVAAELGLRHVIACPVSGALPALKSIAYRLFKRSDIAAIPSDGRQLRFADLIGAKGKLQPVSVDPQAIAVLQYTGGTTGEPKAAMLSHANLVANADACYLHTGGERPEQDRVLGVLPLFHVFALTTVLTFGIRSGAEMILLPRFDLRQVLDTIKRRRPTFFPAVPTIFNAIAGAAKRETVDMSSIHACISGGAPLPSEVRQAFESATGAKVVEGYGLSESSPIITCNPIIEGVNKTGSAGRPFPGTTIEIHDRDNPGHLLEVGQIGEICARGPQIMSGYWNRPDASREVFANGALRTGDVGYLDDEGYLFIVDRIKDVIIAGGYNVYPRVIEEALYEHPAVAEAVVIGVSDPYRGQAPKAFVTLAAGQSATAADLRTFLADKVSKIELPREIEIRETLPKTLIGKLSKKELVEEERAKAAAADIGSGGQPGTGGNDDGENGEVAIERGG
ncbi:long-chain fatty acid--CoA ligase [Sphingosinicella sp. BN140058]|uniref:long-chain-fatty-acid--CoA ligase n=1 Tax=Sphingosinicella sp. BN140058 TaxID=1892855 RepID=UPI0010111575|nr:long-chain fatty acid--CoA ligase [Sphingosinicella sp. BN140058]QAY77983.1 long-chain fatty acid--CoA ligase [Sphingosinicella sp. BN140058]